MKLLLCLFFFSFVSDIYLNIFLNIIIYILVYSGYHIIIEKINIHWSTDISVLIAAMFYLQKNIMYNEIKNYEIDFKYFFFFFFLQITYTKNYFLSFNHGSLIKIPFDICETHFSTCKFGLIHTIVSTFAYI